VLRDFRAGIVIDVLRDFRARHCWVFCTEDFAKSDDLVYLYCFIVMRECFVAVKERFNLVTQDWDQCGSFSRS
jgi:hypothetical protein